MLKKSLNAPAFKKAVSLCALSIFIAGCTATLPKGVLKLSPDNLKHRQLQARTYETQDETKILMASAGVLQDLGFTIEKSETKLGLIVASKDRTAVNAGQVALATAAVFLAALGGTTSDAYSTIDDVQKIRVSVVSKHSLERDAMLVRATFQRIVWNKRGQISRMETLSDPELYTGFFERLSKAIFLEAHKI